MIGACSDAIQKWCRRDFAVRGYDELYNGNGDRRLLLREYPLLSVESVRYRPVTVLKIINNAASTNQQARVTVTSTGLTLMRMASGVKSVDATAAYAGYPTLAGLANHISGLGSGWSAQVVGDSGQGGGQGDYGLWPSSDLYVPPSYGSGTYSQGALTCRGQYAELKMHTYELAGYQWDPRGWLLRAIPYTDPELLHPEDLIWPVGINNFRIQYTSGYPTIPEAVAGGVRAMGGGPFQPGAARPGAGPIQRSRLGRAVMGGGGDAHSGAGLAGAVSPLFDGDGPVLIHGPEERVSEPRTKRSGVSGPRVPRRSLTPLRFVRGSDMPKTNTGDGLWR